jgi:hypothetical protein
MMCCYTHKCSIWDLWGKLKSLAENTSTLSRLRYDKSDDTSLIPI